MVVVWRSSPFIHIYATCLFRVSRTYITATIAHDVDCSMIVDINTALDAVPRDVLWQVLCEIGSA